jgi:hypothetical protein
MRPFKFLVALALIIIGQSTAHVAAGCSSPAPGLKGQTNTDAQTIAFNYDGDSYSLDIYSGFDAQSSGASVYCLRYEVENTSAKPIRKLYWPLASGLQIEALAPKHTPSVTVTTPGTQPVLGSTWIYAFLAEAAKTVAYQTNKQISIPLLRERAPLAPKRDFADGGGFAFVSYKHVAQFEGQELTKTPRKFPMIGSSFSDEKSEVSANSYADWDGKYYSITTVVTRSNPSIEGVQAPFAYALLKGNGAALLSLIREFRNASVPFGKNNDFKASYSSTGGESVLHLVRQPISFEGPSGRVCFLAPAYSPIPIPESLMSCAILNL